jgi:predicted ArsR family transcriptional regulator
MASSYRDTLLKVLADLNGDGGQHAINVGIERAAKDGLAAYHKAIVERDSARHELEKLKDERDDLKASVFILEQICRLEKGGKR